MASDELLQRVKDEVKNADLLDSCLCLDCLESNHADKAIKAVISVVLDPANITHELVLVLDRALGAPACTVPSDKTYQKRKRALAAVFAAMRGDAK